MLVKNDKLSSMYTSHQVRYKLSYGKQRLVKFKVLYITPGNFTLENNIHTNIKQQIYKAHNERYISQEFVIVHRKT